MRYNGLTLKWEVLTRSKEKVFHYWDSQALEKVAQRICISYRCRFSRSGWVKPCMMWPCLPCFEREDGLKTS